jgi:hypothetical protein
MAYIKNGLQVGDEVILTQSFSSCAGTFEKGTKVKITGSSVRGFDVVDEYGNTMGELGFSIGIKV